jgi:hypothetical protein
MVILLLKLTKIRLTECEKPRFQVRLFHNPATYYIFDWKWTA